MGFHRNLACQYAGAEDLQAITDLVDYARRQQGVRAERVAFQLFQLAEVDNGELLLKDVGKSALGQAAMQRHLAAFKSTLLAEARTRTLALGTARRGLAMPRAHAAANPLAALH